jgi:hypothetical protein
MKKIILTFAALLLPIAGLVFGIFAFCGYHAQPKLVKEVIWSPELLEIAPDGAIYGNETAQKFFEKQLLSPPQNIYYGKNQWNPLILRGRKIKKLSGNFFDTNDVKLEFSPGNPDTLYCYYVSERYNNFMTSFVR